MTSQFAQAQVSQADIVKEWERSKAYTKEYLDAMPEASYVLRPTKEMRSFAEQMLHLADANYGLASLAMGVKSPSAPGELEKSSDKTKANVVKIVMTSYDFVIENAGRMSPVQLAEKVKLFGRFEMNKEIALWKVLEHQAHHRGQTTVYLRLAEVTPPQEKLF
ncbi:damage-inducible protein DinB [Pedobacter chinensis]|uniref:Damage-inducible protein DinB n=2 Tax=Pedobacter chinensis TaxID=2282421 RepID=A0A369PSF5_9SPHI|nr:damage-inducible protein DinB [Pedobacter chinensis]